MAKFEIDEFITEFEATPSEAKINSLRRADLFEVAKYYQVSVTSSMRKCDLRDVLLEFFVEEDLLEVPEVKSPQSEAAAIKLKELELLIQREQRQKVEAELELARLRQNQSSGNLGRGSDFDPSKHIKLVPSFQDKDIDK